MAKHKGRKALPAAERRSRRLHAYVAPPEYTLLRQIKTRSETWSGFVRRLILPAAEAIDRSERAAVAQASPPIPPEPSPEERQRPAASIVHPGPFPSLMPQPLHRRVLSSLLIAMLIGAALFFVAVCEAQDKGHFTFGIKPAFAYIAPSGPHGAFHLSNEGTAAVEILVSAQYGVIETDSSGESTHITIGSAGRIGDLTSRLTFFPERLILEPGSDHVLRYMVEGVDALEPRGYITLMHFKMQERVAVSDGAVPAVAPSIAIQYSLVAPLTLLSHDSAPTLTARVLGVQDSTVSLLLSNTSSHPFVGSVQVVERDVVLGHAPVAVYTRRRVEVPLTALPSGSVFTLTFTSDYPGLDAAIARTLTPPLPLEVTL